MTSESDPLKATVNTKVSQLNAFIQQVDNQILRKEEAHQKEVVSLRGLRSQAELSIQAFQSSLINFDKLQNMRKAAKANEH